MRAIIKANATSPLRVCQSNSVEVVMSHSQLNSSNQFTVDPVSGGTTMSLQRALVLILFVSPLCITVAMGQTFYFNANVGYGFASSSSLMIVKTDNANVQGVYGTLGEGPRVGATAGYMFAKSFGLEVAGIYLLGSEIEASAGQGIAAALKYSGTGVLINPSFVLSINVGSVQPYAKFGMAIGFLNVEEQEILGGARTTVDFTGGATIGYQGGVGAVFRANQVIQLFAEASLVSMSFGPSKAEVTEYSINGVNQLPTLPNRTITLEESYPVGSNQVSIRPRFQFSAIGISAGVRVSL
jgi:hypothetical protein